MTDKRTIYCPKCGRKVGTYDGKSTVEKYMKCNKCQKLVSFNPKNGNVGLRALPQRTTSSGMVFY